jgi:antitoxin component YwqK of YwqJK toxin-antitoxin module
MTYGRETPQLIEIEEEMFGWDENIWRKCIDDGLEIPYSGPHVVYYSNDQKMKEGNYRDGLKYHKWTSWYENGIKEAEVNYDESEKLHGECTYWYKNSVKSFEFYYSHGLEHGIQYHYFENGNMKEEYSYLNEKNDGKCTRWYENGQKKLEAFYTNGKYTGKWIWYHENGTIKDTKRFYYLTSAVSDWVNDFLFDLRHPPRNY